MSSIQHSVYCMAMIHWCHHQIITLFYGKVDTFLKLKLICDITVVYKINMSNFSHTYVLQNKSTIVLDKAFSNCLYLKMNV